ncbi:CPBP family intramembrane metalloprotease [Kordia sp. YSTF-M3]|uniref:CPBP family intramembrane metalloprotease n=1 Tax=Kordia aestuariivivens TaxID=2759037 RepID=A0ABR7Q4V0_9FLAO|nr:type II CAAX endopeptidase family protein [Kordia aestuariivivens]MBC8753595.1 CPBP family intramembrane metalloprotease [Kordia aestuariivivens]
MKSKSSFPIWLKLCLFLVTWFVLLLVFEIISQSLLPQFSEKISPIYKLPVRTVNHLFQLVATLSSIWLFTKYIDKIPFISIGFYTKGKLKEFVSGFFLGAIIMAIAFFLLLSLNEIAFNSYWIHIKSILFSILFFTSVSVLEETLCRGYLLGQLVETSNKYVALVVSSIIFTALHSFNPNMATIPVLNLFLAGILLGITYIYTKNLWFPIALHFSWNFFQGPIFGFEVSGQKFYAVIQQTRFEDNLLNGGSFGFEGSLLATFLMLIVIFGIWRFYERKSISS